MISGLLRSICTSIVLPVLAAHEIIKLESFRKIDIGSLFRKVKSRGLVYYRALLKCYGK